MEVDVIADLRIYKEPTTINSPTHSPHVGHSP
jgi:hypothetical protein